MPRRREVAKRKIIAEPVYHSELMAKFINNVMRSGKKSIAEKVVYGALEQALNKVNKQQQNKKDKEGDSGEGGEGGGSGRRRLSTAVDLLEAVIDKVRPTLEVRSRRVGGATYQVPVEVSADRGIALAMRWIIDSAKQRGEKGMVMRLAGEIADAMDGKGGALKECDKVYRMAKANQAFAHFRWN